MTLLKKIVKEKMEKIIAKNTTGVLRNRNANKTIVLLRRSNCVVIVG